MITNEEILNVTKLDAFNRYKYFIKKVVDEEKIYTLSFENEIAEVKDNKLISVWSAAEFAKECAIQEWENYTVTEFSLEEFKDDIGVFITENNLLINVFSVANKTGFIVNQNELWRDINDELEQYD
ncbi:DUF2750 domain-containing protein [Pedobacter cryoconitis]|uniref:Peroxiredoxin n=1 Tax=Pedobacter cryoconitis TaxID=188932 RepID=A0A7X0J5H0_9SPHI|nr:DUF2750 domain-containing protein [Pedobacter cryoconitis]MBB6499991.1 peroxiredoxin [Pedobacter cryoconitis]